MYVGAFVGSPPGRKISVLRPEFSQNGLTKRFVDFENMSSGDGF